MDRSTHRNTNNIEGRVRSESDIERGNLKPPDDGPAILGNIRTSIASSAPAKRRRQRANHVPIRARADIEGPMKPVQERNPEETSMGIFMFFRFPHSRQSKQCRGPR